MRKFQLDYFKCQANSNTNTQHKVPKENNPLHRRCPAFVCGRHRHKRSWVVPCRPCGAGCTGDNVLDGDDLAVGTVLGTGLNIVVEGGTGLLADTARSQPRRLAVEER